MSIVHVTGRGGSIAADRTLFVGLRIPDEIKTLPKLLKTIDKQILRKILQVLVKYLEGNDIPSEAIQDLADSLTEETFAKIFAGLSSLLQAALSQSQSSLKQEIFKEDLEELKIPVEFIPDLASVVYGTRRPVIDATNKANQPHLPRLDNFKWRVDVSISTSVLNRVLEPTVLAEFQLSDGAVHSMEIGLQKFHELRYSIAQLLKEVEHLEQRNILKIQD